MYYTCKHCLKEQGQKIAPLINIKKIGLETISKIFIQHTGDTNPSNSAWTRTSMLPAVKSPIPWRKVTTS